MGPMQQPPVSAQQMALPPQLAAGSTMRPQTPPPEQQQPPQFQPELNPRVLGRPPLTPIADDTPDRHSIYDEAKDGFNLTRLCSLVADCEDQPDWRRRSTLAAAYVDGKQFTPEQESAARAEGLGDVRPINLIGRVIRSVCGQEAKARTDVKIEADDDEVADVCDVLNARLKEAQRETYADMAVSQAYFGQVGPGIGWVEVARNADPLDYPYRVAEVHRDEMWWDWHDPDLMIRGARWVARKRWQDLDELEAAMPQFRRLLRQVSNGWSGFTWDNTIDEAMIQHWQDDHRFNVYQRRSEWYDGARKRIKLYEIWYKVPAMGVVMFLSPTRRVLFNQANPAHVQAVATNQVRVQRCLTRQVRCALFAGPHRLLDHGTTRRNFPYVPFFAYRDDEDLSPYGLVEGMIAPQDGYNRRRLRIEWMLKARQIYVDNDALDTKANTLAEIADRVMRPDLVVVLDANRKHGDGIRVTSDLQLQKEQIAVMGDDKQLIQDVPGVYGSQLGQAQTGVTSGIANSLLIEQGAVAMNDLNDNYRHSRRMVYENLVDLIVQDHMVPNLPVKLGRGSSRRVVVLNAWDPQQQALINNVEDAPVRVGLGEVPATPAFRMQQQQQIAQIVQALAQTSPQAAAVLAPSFIEATDLPDRMERADDVRRVLGLPTAGDRQAAQAAQQQQAEQQQKQAAMAEAAGQLAMEKEAAEVDETKSKTALNKAKVVELGHGLAMASMQQAHAEQPEPADPDAQQQRLIQEALAEAMQ